MIITINWPQFIAQWWDSRRARLRHLESELKLARNEIKRQERKNSILQENLRLAEKAAQYWARINGEKNYYEFTMSLIKWRAVSKQVDDGVPFVDARHYQPTRVEAIGIFTELWDAKPAKFPARPAQEQMRENVKMLFAPTEVVFNDVAGVDR